MLRLRELYTAMQHGTARAGAWSPAAAARRGASAGLR